MAARVAVKICGIKSPEALFAAAKGGAAYAGFVFHEASPRNLSVSHAAVLRAMMPATLRLVALVVDANDALLSRINGALSPDIFQLHGQESVQRVAEIRSLTNREVVKAIGVARSEDLAPARAYEAVADYLLFDAKAPAGALPGGSGKSFDWKLLAGAMFTKPWFLSGGLNAGNIAAAAEASGARLVDVSSGVEATRGQKDPALIAAFLDTVRGL